MWESFLNSIVPSKQVVLTMLGFLSPLLLLFVLVWWEKRRRKSEERPPQEEKLLRPPGHSLSLRLEIISDEGIEALLRAMVLGGLATPLMVVASAFLSSGELKAWSALPLAGAGALAILCVHQTRKTWLLAREARNCRLGLSGEQAVAEALAEVGPAGYRAFHDLPGGDHWNVDHVAVGPQGVFVIETKARRRRLVAGKQAAHKVAYDSERLVFPTGEDRDALPQVRRNAKWVADYLTKHTGETVATTPLLVLPGWYVERITSDTRGVTAMNTAYLVKFLTNQPENLPPAQVRRIIAALELKCRDVEF